MNLIVKFNEDEADLLRGMIGNDPGQASEVTLRLGMGHSGFGLYLHQSEHAEDGAELLTVVVPSHKHIVRGSSYREFARGSLQAAQPVVDDDELVAYLDTGTGRVFFRPPTEFDSPDRFERLTFTVEEACELTDQQISLAEQLAITTEERDALSALVNSPQTAEFLSAVQAEGAHQVQRYGEARDRSKSATAWFHLLAYLSGKACRAAIEGDKEKALHHCISSAAMLGEWFKAIQADTTGCGDGLDIDLSQGEG